MDIAIVAVANRVKDIPSRFDGDISIIYFKVGKENYKQTKKRGFKTCLKTYFYVD